ncbi:hypothetical protein BC629DRAFT_1434869 [Irpex lacteus]|nr:hypothetical protein BC629DRAFT_1434869 [Irpex lacteus]
MFPRLAWKGCLNHNHDDTDDDAALLPHDPRTRNTYQDNEQHPTRDKKMAKQQQQHPAVPASAPTSPAVIRSKSDRTQPATPQRVMQRAHRQLQSSPYTPAASFASPYTPLSIRSFSTSTASSLATPSSAAANRRHSLSLSPEQSFHAKGRKSTADATDNWRNRAHEHGIRVGLNEDSRFADDEDDGDVDLDTSSFFATDKALLPAPFLSTQRRARAFTQALPQAPSMSLGPIASPVQMSTPARGPRAQSFALSPAFLNTPPPNPDLLSKFRLRGTVTDPAQTRRRPGFGQVSDLCDIDEDEYMPYLEDFPSSAMAARIQSQTLPLHFQDPFDMSELSEMYQEAHSMPVLAAFEPPRAAPPPSPPSSPACSVSDERVEYRGRKGYGVRCLQSQGQRFQTAEDLLAQHRGSSEDTAASDGIIHRQSAGSSTPVSGGKAGRSQGNSARTGDRAVLRIDNVPWDITPPPSLHGSTTCRASACVARSQGENFEHAFVEMASADAAKAALRTSQNSVLGKGKRARGVTVTRSNQESSCDRCSHPGKHGLISDAELKSLLHLIRSPDSPFLKVPSLPFHSLISILSKIPSDDDSKVFWSGNLRDTLYAKIDGNPSPSGQLDDSGAFTAEQMSRLSDILEAALPQSTSSPISSRNTTVAPSSGSGNGAKSYGDLAKEFGVDTQIVEALIKRLSDFP